jgi:hypothetical protein
MGEERMTRMSVTALRARDGIQPKMIAKLESLTKLMTDLIRKEFTSQGGIGRVEKFEEISEELNK